jgi:hypothetical protein
VPGRTERPVDVPARTRRPVRDRLAALRRALRSLLVATPVLTLLGYTHGVALGRSPAFLDDEGTYAAQAWSLIAQHRLSPYTYWYDHPPLGWVQLAGWFDATGALHRNTPIVVSAREFALVCAVISGALLFLLGRRAGLSRWTAAVPVLAIALSPLAVNYERLAYLDNFATPWLIASFVLVLSPKRRLWAAAGGGLCFAIACLTKETSLLFAPGLFLAAWLHADRRTRTFTATALGSAGVLVLAFYPLFAVLRGELIPGPGHVSLGQALAFQLWSRPSTGSPLDPHSFARTVVNGWTSLDGWLLAGGLVAALACLVSRRLRFVAVALGVPILVSLRGGYLPQPFVVAILPFAALAIGGALDLLWRIRPPVGRVTAVMATVAAVALVTPQWAEGDGNLLREHENLAATQAAEWMGLHVPHRDRVIVDDSMWVDMVRQGFSPHMGVVWMYKLNYQNNLDPSVRHALPDGWRDCQYILATPILRKSVTTTPGGMAPIAAALRSSHIVAIFGSGDSRVEVRRVISGL